MPFHIADNGDIIGPGGGVFTPARAQVIKGYAVLSLDGLNQIFQLGLLAGKLDLDLNAPHILPEVMLKLNVEPVTHGQFSLEVLDWVLAERVAGHEPNGASIARQFSIPLKEADALYDRLKEMGRTR